MKRNLRLLVLNTVACVTLASVASAQSETSTKPSAAGNGMPSMRRVAVSNTSGFMIEIDGKSGGYFSQPGMSARNGEEAARTSTQTVNLNLRTNSAGHFLVALRTPGGAPVECVIDKSNLRNGVVQVGDLSKLIDANGKATAACVK